MSGEQPEIYNPIVVEPQANPNPPNEPGPQIGDKYTDGVRTLTVTAVGEKHALAHDDANTANEDKYPLIPIAEGGTFRPVVQPAIVYADTTLYEYHILGAERGLWSNPGVAAATGRRIVLKPGQTPTAGTWVQV